MLRLTRKLLPRVAVVVVGFLVGHICSATAAFEGDFYLPEQAESNVVFELSGEQPVVDPSDVFQVFVGSNAVCCEGSLPIAGRYSIEERTVTFDPAFDFIEGQHYTVKISGKDGALVEDANAASTHFIDEFTIKRSNENVNPEVVAIYPSGDQVPENTLRFYIHFSTPMRPNVSSDFIKLLDASGAVDTAAFMTFKQELWSEDRKRLTLLMDPGRIKRGVSQNLALGPALQEGRTHSIVVNAGWPTANDAQEMPRFESVFTTSKALRTIPDPENWTIVSPKYMSSEPLLIEFDRPFDSELLLSGITVLDENGQAIAGVISLEKNERAWRFDRKGLWQNSQIQIAVDPLLEDVAGNNFFELLDHSLGAPVTTPNQLVISVKLES